MGNSDYLLEVIDVYKSYGDHLVLDNVDLRVRAGEFCTLVGPSGCGKSTLLRLILGQEEASAGKILIEAQPVGLPDKSRGIVFQRYGLYPHLNVLNNVTLGKRFEAGFWGWFKVRQEHETQALRLLDIMRVSHAKDKYPHELSGGMQQRVAIAQALMMNPKVLLMDEPFGALDPTTREDMQVYLLELWQEFRTTIFFVTHDLEEALFLGSRLLVLSQYYTDDRGVGVSRGAKLVADYRGHSDIHSTAVKSDSQFRETLQGIRREGFDPEFLNHVDQFNLTHPDSWRTLTHHESIVSAKSKEGL